jgi:hypothetical protein
MSCKPLSAASDSITAPLRRGAARFSVDVNLYASLIAGRSGATTETTLLPLRQSPLMGSASSTSSDERTISVTRGSNAADSSERISSSFKSAHDLECSLQPTSVKASAHQHTSNLHEAASRKTHAHTDRAILPLFSTSISLQTQITQRESLPQHTCTRRTTGSRAHQDMLQSRRAQQ